MGVIIMKRLVISGFIFLLILLIGAPVQARILIPLADLEITEFTEEVGLIWNGSEEIVIQKLILEADSSGYILDLMPLPAEPVFNDDQDDKIFSVTREGFINRQRGFAHPDYFFEPPQEYQSLELVDQELLHGSETDYIIGAINEFLAASDQNSIEITDAQLEILEDYLINNIEYFHLRLIDIPDELASRTDSWQFDSDLLYYPLEANLSSSSYFTLIQTSPHLDFYDYQSVDFEHYIPPRLTRPDVLREIDPELSAFFDTVLLYTFFWELNL